MSGENITNARPQYDQNGQIHVALEFNSRGGSIFERITGDNIGRRMAIVLDGKVYSAPVIQSRISGGKAVITGNFTLAEAQDLAVVLRAGLSARSRHRAGRTHGRPFPGAGIH